MCGFDDMSPLLHKQLCEWYQMGYDDNLNNLIMIPRTHLKTTIFTVGESAWQVIRNHEIRIAISMVNSTAAKKKLRLLRHIFTNTNGRMAHFFPECMAIKATETEIEVPRNGNYGEATITAWGIGAEIVSGHYDIFKLDDPIGNEDEDSKVKISAAKSYLDVLPGLYENPDFARVDIIGTAWPGGFYEKLIESPLYRKLILGAEVDDRYYRFLDEIGYTGDRKPVMTTVKIDGKEQDLPTPIWERGEVKGSKKGFTPQTLLRLRKHMDTKYSHQYLNLFINAGDIRFREEDIMECRLDRQHDAVLIGPQDHAVAYPARGLMRVLTVDPSTGEGNDESAIVVSGYVRNPGYGFIMDAWSGKVLTNDLIDQILVMAERWKVDIIAPEETSYQKILKHAIRDVMIRRRKHYRIIPAKPGHRGKPQRIDGFQPWVAGHQVFFNLDNAGVKKLVEEMFAIRIIDGKLIRQSLPGSSPNLVDALCYHGDFWLREPEEMFDDEIDFEQEVDEPRRKRKIAARYGLACAT